MTRFPDDSMSEGRETRELPGGTFKSENPALKNRQLLHFKEQHG